MSRPLRVLYSFPHPVGAPGIGTTAWEQVHGVIDAGADVLLYVTSVARPVVGANRVRTTLSVGRRRIPHRALGRGRAYEYHDRRVASAIRRRAEQIDVVHCWPSACLETARAARERGIPVLREAPSAHTAEAFEQAAIEQELTGVSLPPGHAFRFDAARLAREEAEFAAVDCLLVPSRQAAQTYEARGIPSHRIAQHQYGYDPEEFAPTARRQEDLQAIFVGRGEPTKGLHYALAAWTQSTLARRARFLVVGDMLPDYKRYLQPLLSHPSVELRPFSTDVGSLLGRASLLILSSVTEGSALVTYEAFGAGCVGLVSDATGAPCVDGFNGLLHPRRDPNTLRGQLDLLDSDPTTLGRLRDGVAARRDELTWARAGEVLMARYRERARPVNNSATQV